MAVLKVEIELPQNLLVALDIPELGRRAREWVLLESFRKGRSHQAKPDAEPEA